MVMILYTIMYIMFIFVDIIPIVKRRQWRAFGVYSVIFISAYVLTIMVIQGAQVYSPAESLEKIVQSIIGK